MTVYELIGLLTHCSPTDKVAIPVEVGHITIGGEPRLDVESVRRGFDWSSGTVFLHGTDETRLTVMSKEEYIQLIRYKQLVSGMRGKEDIEHLSDVFVKKDVVLQLLRQLTAKLSDGSGIDCSDVNDIINEIYEEKL